jgi:hypothetical protein
MDVAVWADLDSDRVGEQCLLLVFGRVLFVCGITMRRAKDSEWYNLSQQATAFLCLAVAGRIAFAERVAHEVWFEEAGKFGGGWENAEGLEASQNY